MIGHVLALVGIVVFVSLGFWQLRRLDEKREFNDSVEAGLAAEAVPLSEAPDGTTYRRVTADGSFDRGYEALVLRSRDGVSGFHVLTPFLLGDGSAVLVDRGWVPIQYDAPGGADFGPPQGEVSIEGLLWPAQDGSGVPEDLPDVVRRIDPEIQSAFTPYPLRSEYLVLTEDQAVPDHLPIAEEPPPLSEGPHLGYAVQWFLFAGVVVVGYPALLRRTVRKDG